jgi:hypothetical protein
MWLEFVALFIIFWRGASLSSPEPNQHRKP